jgi:hypothetical protein
MDTVTLSKNELKELLHDTVQETIAEIFLDEDNFFNFIERIEDRNLGMLMEEGQKTDLIDPKEFRSFLKQKIASL